ncbi:Dyggve-Melchior-Clausen syndrome protein [Seminavis robusta]|uniref:Dymeclin n=1 Tax=Seminavis robusta TaxID=568900 RepID=A0A9N8HSK2_9STRA|nr:Dyggve-Melchior-Clausen syndrome protein [Seminavis robusta]|eukprot:Sro1177_g249350.1 Dyggve-Melchior-Clausen syndrome protein (928) ;mRNA; r:6830-9704
MWGDPERALRLDASDTLSMLLFQVASPAHIPWNDPRWQELLHGFDVWVHVEVRDDPEGVLHQACQSMARHAANNSNLAALARLVCQMLDELCPQGPQQTQIDQVAEFSERIAIVGKARAAAGTLQLIRLFIHRIVVEYANQPAVLVDVFTYRTRDASEKDSNMGKELTASLFRFLTSDKIRAKITEVPEMYDTAVLALQLLLVMLSTQLYQPMLSSLQKSQQQSPQVDFFLDLLMEQTNPNNNGKSSHALSPGTILTALLAWQIQRPRAPERSIARYHFNLAQQVVAAKGEKVGPDGMYESNLVVSAAQTTISKSNDHSSSRLGDSSSHLRLTNTNQPSFLLDATKGVLVQASTIILLPFRLVSLALGLWGHKQKGFDTSRANHYKSSMHRNSRTRDVLWISESPVADLASCLFLILTNNRRATKTALGPSSPPENNVNHNPFREELATLADNRWDSAHAASTLPDLPGPMGDQLNESISLLDSFEAEGKQESLPGSSMVVHHHHHSTMTLNFETLFSSFEANLHTEVGALLLYTLLQSSQAFSQTIAVRSDLDTLVLPLLRTLYFSSSSRHVSALDFQSKGSTVGDKDKNGKNGGDNNGKQQSSIRTMPFRSPSQLYVIVILLLLFSQDPSFGSDAFRRTMVSSVPWYKERFLKDISLGSVVILALLRNLTFNLNRLHDLFLLSNCCAVLMNLSHSVVDLHEYAAMRLASVTVSCLKKYVALAAEEEKNGGDEIEDDAAAQLDMYSEVSHTLLRLLKHALAQKNIERNLHLAYALVYHQADFKKIFSMKHSPFKKSEINRISNLIKTASKIIEFERSASKALQVLSENMDQLKEAVAEKRKKSSEKEDFAFTYEEESDPEIFFIPYIWEVAVCAVTASSLEWQISDIQVFPLLEEELPPSDVAVDSPGAEASPMSNVFANDVMDVV